MGNLEANLKEKIDKIVLTHKRLKEDNRVLKERNEILEQVLRDNEVKISELTRNYENINIAKSLESSDEGSGDSIKQINNMVREINKCIALLNT